MFEWLFNKVKMGCSSGRVCSVTAMMGGWYVCTMDSGREEFLRDPPVGLDDGEWSSEVGESAYSPSVGGVVAADDDADGGSLPRSRGIEGAGESIESGLESCLGRGGLLLRKVSLLGDDAGVGVLESL